MNDINSVNQVLHLVEKLPLVDTIRLIERIAPQIQRELQASPNKLRKSMRSLWRGLDITEEDIYQAGWEMWDNFPRDDVKYSISLPIRTV